MKKIILALFLVLSALVSTAPTLSWLRNPEPEVAGYLVYRGAAPREYTSVADVGNVIQYGIPNPVPGATEFFAVTAYTAERFESDFSDEVNWTARQDIPSTQYIVWRIPAGLHLLESCDDLTAAVWSRVGLIQGPFDYLIPVDVTVPQRFYRYAAQ